MGRTRQRRQSGRQSEPAQPASQPTEAEVAALIAAILGGAIAVSSPSAAVAFALAPILIPFGLPSAESEKIASESARLALDNVPDPPGGSILDPLGKAHIQNLIRRGQYAIAATKRLARRVGQGASIREALISESPFLQKHRKAESERISSAEAARAHLRRYGRQATWIHGDPKEPRPHHLAADGGQFDVTNPPASVEGVLPGVLPGCTCTIGAPRPGARRLG